MGYFRVRVNLGLVIKGPPVDLEGLYEEVRRYADSHGLELIYGEVSGDKLYIRKGDGP